MSSVNSSSSSSGGGGVVGGGPCGACKFLRRKCVMGCIFAPYFDADQGANQFGAVHKVFGASNVSKLLFHIPVQKRLDAVATICFEAQARLHDPVYGCVSHIFALQQQVVNLQAELSHMQAHLETLQLPSRTPPPSPLMLVMPPSLSIGDQLPSASSLPAASFDASTLFDPQVQTPWTLQQPEMELGQYSGGGGGGGGRNPSHSSASSTAATATGGSGGGDLHALARELRHRHGSLVGSSHSTEPSTATTNLRLT